MNLFEELKGILEKLHTEKIDYALCGGLAMAVYAFPRSTLDIDLIIDSNDLERVKLIAKELGFIIDAGMMSFKEGKIQIYRMAKIDPKGGDPLILDLLLVTEDISQVWDNRVQVEWEWGSFSVVSPEGLIQLKSMRKSGQDEDDIKRLRSIIDEN